MAEPLRLLVVCLGNICRSPLAEGALRARLDAAGLGARVAVDSAGTAGWHAGKPPDPRSVAIAARHGVDISRQRARQLQAADFDRFDWILCADHDVLATVRALAKDGCRARSALLLAWAGQGDRDIPDPYYGADDGFASVWAMVDAAAGTVAARLAARDGSQAAIDA